VIRQSAHSLLSLLVMGLGKALFVLLTANLYGPEGQGVVTLGISVMVLVSLFLGLGTDLSVTYLVGQSPSRLSALRVNSALLSVLALGATLGVLAVAFRIFGTTVFRDFPSEGRLALVVLVGFQVYHLQIQGLTVGLGRFHDLTVANLFQYLSVVPGVWVLHLTGQPAVTVLYLWAGGLLVKTVYLLSRLPSVSAESPEGRLEVMRRQLIVGRQMMLGNLANLLNFRLDAYFIAYFLPATHLGWYAVASMIAEGTLYLPKAFGQVVFSWAAQERNDAVARAQSIRNVFLTASYLTLAMMLLVQLLLRPAMSLLFGEAFLPALAPARVLLVASVLYGIGLVAMNLIYGLGNPTWNTRAGMIAAGLNALGNAFAIPRWGILGAAYASLFSYAVYCLLNLANVGKYLPGGASLRYLLVPDREYLTTSLTRLRHAWARRRG